MNSSLRDQLIQAGLVSKKQAQQTNQPKKAPSRHQPQGPSQAQVAAQKAAAAKAERDKELNRRQQEKAAAKARRQEIRQLVEEHRLPKLETDDYFNFVDGKTLHRICVDAAQRAAVMEGKAVIARFGTHYALIPEAVAPRILEKDPTAIISLKNEPSSQASTETADGYENFKVPDDLMW